MLTITSSIHTDRLVLRQEAHFRQSEWFKGAWGDEFVFAILEDEWAAQNAGRPRAGQAG